MGIVHGIQTDGGSIDVSLGVMETELGELTYKFYVPCYFRDYTAFVDDEVLRSDLRTEFMGCTADEAAWNTTYGSFEDGSARRMELLFGSTFGGPFISILIVFVPQVLVFSVLCTYIYRRTGNIYTGAFTVAAMACWIVTGGSAIL